MLRHTFALTILSVLILAGSAAAQRSAASRPGAKDAAALIKKVRQDEAWLSQAETLSLKVTSTFERTRQQVAQRTADIGGMERMSAITMNSIIPAGTLSSTFVMDKKRSLYVREEKDEPIPGIESPLQKSLFFRWDGEFSFLKEVGAGERSYRRGKQRPSRNDARMGLFWPLLSDTARMMASGGQEEYQEAASLGFYVAEHLDLVPAEDFTLGGTQVVNGVNCQVVQSPLLSQKLYISLDDQRLMGASFRALTPNGRGTEQSLRQLTAPTVGLPLQTSQELLKWYSAQPVEQRKKFVADYRKRLFIMSRPCAELTFSDFREAAPGCWIPGKVRLQSLALNKAYEPYLYTRWEANLEDAKVNQPLFDAAFEPPVAEGTTIIDSRFGTPVSYRYRKGMSDQEAMQMPAATAPRDGGGARSSQQPGARRSGTR